MRLAKALLFEIGHRTTYSYSEPVFLYPHTLRLKPATDGAHRLLSFALAIEPQPTGRSDNIDLDGTDTTVVWFDPTTDHLTIEAKSRVETLRPNPFDFLWLGENRLPLRYPAQFQPPLTPYTGREVPVPVRQFADNEARAAGGDPQAFLLALTRQLHETHRQIRRDEGEPWPAEETLRREEGSCRDLTVLFMSACRALGFAARFVSGYFVTQSEFGHDLHAWAEVYLPGGGWRAYDPTTGLAVADHHIALARAATPRLAAPVSGSYQGNATSELKTELTIRQLD